MAGITLTQAETQLALWLGADTAVAAGQSYAIAGRTLARSDAKTIRENLDYWDKKVRQLSATGANSGRSPRGVTPVI